MSRAAKQDKSFLSEKLQSANWLVKALNQRAETILKVAIEIVKQQDGFFRQGIEHLRPLVLRDVADAIEMHESTVSRVTTNKYVHTPHGIYELKYFFNSAISRSDGEEDLASESVKQKIKEMVSAEDPKKPISDQQLTEMLAEQKIKIARRTVAKYREALAILPSNKRKKYF